MLNVGPLGVHCSSESQSRKLYNKDMPQLSEDNDFVNQKKTSKNEQLQSINKKQNLQYNFKEAAYTKLQKLF